MKTGMGAIIGKRIVGAFLRIHKGQPKGQLLLAFDDGTSYEFYSGEVIRVTGGLWAGDVEQTSAYLRQGQLFCYEARFDPKGLEVIERQYAGEKDMKCDRVRHLKPPPIEQEDWDDGSAAWERFLKALPGAARRGS